MFVHQRGVYQRIGASYPHKYMQLHIRHRKSAQQFLVTETPESTLDSRSRTSSTRRKTKKRARRTISTKPMRINTAAGNVRGTYANIAIVCLIAIIKTDAVN
ncbi:hypothetical protein NDU88_000218 [Pleurodeles waltl]|uniref:Uncharacterized protein n=1 Tax=Pleurodeles waltl TaxID=8319 RepID=A0AAV7USH4_PLEWA|nr:hypothetical protein NDU88_000218 [Pleurodeles waltl]